MAQNSKTATLLPEVVTDCSLELGLCEREKFEVEVKFEWQKYMIENQDLGLSPLTRYKQYRKQYLFAMVQFKKELEALNGLKDKCYMERKYCENGCSYCEWQNFKINGIRDR